MSTPTTPLMEAKELPALPTNYRSIATRSSTPDDENPAPHPHEEEEHPASETRPRATTPDPPHRFIYTRRATLRRRSSAPLMTKSHEDPPAPGSWEANPLVGFAELHPDDEDTPWRQRWHGLLESHRTHILILCLVLLDLAIVMTEVFAELFQYQKCIDFEAAALGEKFHVAQAVEVMAEVFRWISVGIMGLFVLEMVAKLIVFRLQYFTQHWLHLFDAVVVLLSFFASLFLQGASETIASFFIFLRLWRVFRIIDGVAVAMEDSKEKKARQLAHEIDQLKLEVDKWKKRAEGTLTNNGKASESAPATRTDEHAAAEREAPAKKEL